MERAPAGALPFPLQPMFAKSWAQPLCQQLARCAVQLQERMRARFEDPDATPFPPFLDGRARDLWLPLLALGEEVGEPWNTYIREACAVLARAAADDIADSGEQLLADVRRFFDGRRDQYATPSDLLSWLVEQDGSPWPEYAHGRPLTARGLATLLQPFKIKSAPARIGGAKTRAYYAADFNEAWKRYNTPSGSALHSGNISSASEPSHAFPVVGERGTHGTLGTDGTSPKRFGLFTDGALGDETTDPPRSTTGHGGPGLENVPFARAG